MFRNVCRRFLFTSIRYNNKIEHRFVLATDAIQNNVLDQDLGTKLRLYALWKQASEGTCTMKKPTREDFTKRYKWDAWHGLGNMSKQAAMDEYVSLANEVLGHQGMAGV